MLVSLFSLPVIISNSSFHHTTSHTTPIHFTCHFISFHFRCPYAMPAIPYHTVPSPNPWSFFWFCSHRHSLCSVFDFSCICLFSLSAACFFFCLSVLSVPSRPVSQSFVLSDRSSPLRFSFALLFLTTAVTSLCFSCHWYSTQQIQHHNITTCLIIHHYDTC